MEGALVTAAFGAPPIASMSTTMLSPVAAATTPIAAPVTTHVPAPVPTNATALVPAAAPAVAPAPVAPLKINTIPLKRTWSLLACNAGSMPVVHAGIC